MAYIYNGRIYLTADDEDPNCLNWANMDRCREGEDPADGGTAQCGPEHGWRCYYRVADAKEVKSNG